MALIRGNTYQASSRRPRVDDFISPNLILSTLLAFVPFGARQEAAAAPATPRQRQEIRVQQAQNLLTTILAIQAPSDIPRLPILQSASIQRQGRQDLPPPNLLLSTLASAPETPSEDIPRAPIFQEVQRHAPRGVVVNYSLNLAIGTEIVTPGTETLRAPILQSQPRRARFRGVEIYLRAGMGESPVEPAGDPFFQKISDIDLSIRKPRAIVVNYSLNLPIGQFRLLPGEGLTASAPRGLRRHIVEPIPNLLTSTLFVTPQEPFRPVRWEQESATKRKRPVPVESQGINNQVRGGGAMPFEPPRREHESATRRKQPLQVESLAINLPIRTIPDDPFKPLRTEQQTATRARRDQNANTWLHRHNFALVEADKHFKYDWTITRGRRQHPQEPIFRNFILSQPLAAPFEPRRTAQEPSPRRRPVHDRPTLDQNFQLPLWAHVKPIGAQHFEPAPRPRQSVARYTFLHPVNLNLLGKDTFFYGPGRGPFNYDWEIKYRRRYIERNNPHDIQRGVPIGVIDFNPSVPGLEYSTFLAQLDYRSKPDRLHFESLKDRLHYRIEDEDE